MREVDVSGFVTSRDGQLWADGRPFHFSGFNNCACVSVAQVAARIIAALHMHALPDVVQTLQRRSSYMCWGLGATVQ